MLPAASRGSMSDSTLVAAQTGENGAFDLSSWMESERRLADRALERAMRRWRGDLPGHVAEAMEHGLLGEGKRLRAILCVTAFRACGGRDDAVHDLAASLELIHAYSLMHDDLPCMDDAELRRGRPTTHRVHGERAAVTAGAAMIPLAALHAIEACRALGVDEGRTRRVASELCAAAGAGGMVGGQALDLQAEGEALGAGELDVLHRLKTGALLTAALRMGALAAGADPTLLAALDAYGRAVGLAFQIADDVLDATASASELGKNPSDSALGKATYVSVHGLEEARGRAVTEAARARAALREAELDAPALDALAEYVVSRGR